MRYIYQVYCVSEAKFQDYTTDSRCVCRRRRIESEMLGKRTGSVNQEDSSLRHDTFAKKLLTIRSFFANKQQPENKMQVTATFTKKKKNLQNILCFFGILYPSSNKVASMLIARKIQTFELKVEFQGDTWMGFLV
jgi:hypothetical protein